MPSSEPAFASRGSGEPPVGVERLPSDGWHPGTESPSLIDLMSLDEAGWEAFSRGSAVRRAGLPGLRRNIAVALGHYLGCASLGAKLDGVLLCQHARRRF